MAENKLMMACHAQVYFVHEIAVELQPTVQTILVYETLPEELPAEIFKMDLGISRDDDIRVFSINKPIGKALYDDQKWVDYTSTTGKHCLFHVINILYLIRYTDTKLHDTIYYQPIIYAYSENKGRYKCPYCSSDLYYMQANYAYYTDEGIKFDVGDYCYCHYCKMPFLTSTYDLDHGFQTYHFEVEKYSLADAKRIAFKVPDIAKKTPKQKPYKSIPFPDANLSVPPPNKNSKPIVVHVFAEKCYCRHCSNKYNTNTVESHTAYVLTADKRCVPVNVEFCTACGKYFMNYRSYNDYCKQYGPLLLEVEFSRDCNTGNDRMSSLARNSILSRCGYHARAEIPKSQRQAVLAYILESKRANKSEIKSILSFLMDFNSTKPSMEGTISRWNEDYIFVDNYKLGSQPIESLVKLAQGGNISERYRWI